MQQTNRNSGTARLFGNARAIIRAVKYGVNTKRNTSMSASYIACTARHYEHRFAL